MSAASAKRVKPEQQVQRNVKKWTKPLMDAGWTVIPNVIIQRQQALGLDSVDINIIAYLSSLWWMEENPPFPAVKSIAEIIGITPRSVQRRIARLEEGGLLERDFRQEAGRGQVSNRYRLTKLIEAATPYAEEELARRKERQREDAETRTRKKPRRLRVVPRSLKQPSTGGSGS